MFIADCGLTIHLQSVCSGDFALIREYLWFLRNSIEFSSEIGKVVRRLSYAAGITNGTQLVQVDSEEPENES